MNLLSLILLESWPGLVVVLSFFALLGVVAGAGGGGIAFVRAKERLQQRIVLGVFAGVLTSCIVFWSVPGPNDTITTHILCCIVGGYAGADGISVLLKTIGRSGRKIKEEE